MIDMEQAQRKADERLAEVLAKAPRPDVHQRCSWCGTCDRCKQPHEDYCRRPR